MTGILAAIAVPGLLRARIAANEASAIGSIRTIHSAEMSYASTCGGGGFAASLADLGSLPAAGMPFIPADITSAAPGGTPKSGYEFTITGTGTTVRPAAETCNGATGDPTAGFFTQADPRVVGTSGIRFFATDQTGHIRQHTAQISDMSAGTPLQ